MGGGYALVDEADILKLPLPIAGIMTDKNPVDFLSQIDGFEKELISRGISMDYPLFMLSSAFTVSSIPHVKITDKGLYSVDEDVFRDLMV